MDTDSRTFLGTRLRRLIELLDGAVEAHYVNAGLAYRPRYTPVVRTLLALGSASIQEIAQHAGLSHSATSQTVAQMEKARLLRLKTGADARTRIASLTPRTLEMAPLLEQMWETTNNAAARLEGELSYPLSDLLQETFAALERESFFDRIENLPYHHRPAASTPSQAQASRRRTLSGRRQ